MKLRWALLLALTGVLTAQQFNQDIVPASSGLRLGHSNQRWNGFLHNVDINGTCVINGTPCGSGSGGTSISSYTVATLPPSPTPGTLAIVTDGNGPSCTIGGSSTRNLCQFTGFQWVIVSGGTGSAPSFNQITAGINTTALQIGTGGSLSTTGTGTILATNVAQTKLATLNQWLDSYDSVSRTFHTSQPSYDNISGGIARVGEIRSAANNPWLLFDNTASSSDGLKFTLLAGSASILANGASTNISLGLVPKGTGTVNITNAVASTLALPYVTPLNCLTTDALGVVRDAGAPCGSGGGSVTFPIQAPDGSSSSAQYTFTNHPELGFATTLGGDKPQIRQVVVTGAGPGQTITLTVSSPINNLSWNSGDRIILTGLPSSPTDLTSLNITSPSFWTISSVTGTSPTGTATFSTAATTITPGTYAVTTGNAQIYDTVAVGRSLTFNRFTSSTTNPAQTGSIRFARRDAIKARSGFSDDTTLDVSLLRGSAAIAPTNSPGTGVMTVNGAHSSGATTLSIAKQAGTSWSAVAGDAIIIAAANGDSDNQKYTLTANATVTQGTNTSVTITPGLKTALNGGELVVTRFIRTQAGEETGLEVPGDAEFKGNITLTSTNPTLIQVKKQSGTPSINTAYDAGWYLDSTNHFHCKLSAALGGGDCAPLTSGSGYSTIDDEAVALPQQTTVNFTGAGVTCVDNPGSSRTDCTIPGGAGVTGSGTTSKILKWASPTSAGDSTIDDGLTTVNTVTIAATSGLNITGDGTHAGIATLKGGTVPLIVTGQVGYAGPASVTSPWLVSLPGAGSTGFLAATTPTLSVYPGVFRSIAGTSPITVTNGDGASGNPTVACSTCGVTGTGLGQFASTTSAQLATVLSDEIGSGKAVFASALQGTDANLLTAGTFSGSTGNPICRDANGGATDVGCSSATAAGGSNTQLQYNNATVLGGISGWTTNGSTTMTGGATSVLDLSAMAPASGLKLPIVAGAIPTADGFLGVNSTIHATVFGSNGTTMIAAAAATGTSSSTACAASKWVSTISGIAAPTCTQPAVADLSDGANVITSASTATSGRIALGNGGKALQFPAGFSTDGTSAATFGVQNTSVGKLTLSGSDAAVGELDINIAGATGNPLVIKPGANSSTVTLTGPTSSGTIPSSATSPVTLSAAGAIGCATCVVASSPGAGIAHFAGSTQTVTSSAVVDADVSFTTPNLGTPSAATLTNATGLPAASVVAGALANGMTATTQSAADNSTKLATTAYADAVLKAQYKTLICERGLGDGLNAMAAGTYLQSTCYNYTGATITITGIKCLTDNNGTSTLNATDGSANALLTGAITCTNSFASGTQSATTTIASGGYVKFTFVADGTSKQTDWVILETY